MVKKCGKLAKMYFKINALLPIFVLLTGQMRTKLHFRALNSTVMSKKATFSFLLFIAAISVLRAQCDRVGWVASVTPGCGAKIIDLDNGAIYRAYFGAGNLSGGQTISFTTSAAPVPPGCTPGNAIPVSLVCVSDTLPCTAHYGYFSDEENPLKFTFSANLYDADAQNCHWDFGDGSNATGQQVSHGFPSQGDYQVCLTVSDNFGCSAEYCETISVSAQLTNGCGYNIQVTAVGTQLYGKLSPVDPAADPVQSVLWYSSKSSNVLSQNESFSAPLPGYGTYQVCAQYVISNASGSFTCASSQCRELTVAEPGCENPVMADASALCPSQSALYIPVCGCNGITYGNECEAIAAGVSNWRAGTCAEQNIPCAAHMDVRVTEGSPDEGYIARFVNHSSNAYTFAQIDFGDGVLWEGTSWDTIYHPYPAGGVYRTNLTTWTSSGCVSSVVQLLITDASHMTASDVPDDADYVRPGDTNKDGKANAYDLLPIGVGHYSSGSPRPDASTSWTMQFAPNWMETVADAVNYKHLDCNGNGAVNEYDVDVISQHYVPLDTAAVIPSASAPQLRVVFESDTVLVNSGVPAPVEIKGKVLLGSPTRPALGVYGLAFAMHYPEFVGHNPEADYKSDYFGSPNHILWLSRDNHSRSQLDLGITRKNGLNANGYGAIAEITFRADFIIIIDVAGRSTDRVIPFTVPVNGIKAIDNKGNPKDITVPVQQDTVWIKLTGTTASAEAAGTDILLSPNPATTSATLLLGESQEALVEILDPSGRSVMNQSVSGNLLNLALDNFPAGVYTVRVQSDNRLVTRKLTILRQP